MYRMIPACCEAGGQGMLVLWCHVMLEERSSMPAVSVVL